MHDRHSTGTGCYGQGGPREEEIHKDEKMKKLEEKLSDLELAIEEAQSTSKGQGKQSTKGEGTQEDPAVERLMKQKARAGGEDRRAARRAAEEVFGCNRADQG